MRIRTVPFVFAVSFFAVTENLTAQFLDGAVDRFETKNFSIAIEQSARQPRPTAKEVGVLVEKLCSQLDKIFVKYSPYHLANDDESEDSDKKSASAKKPPVEAKADPNRVIPRCNIYLFNTRQALEAKCQADGVEPIDEGYAGFFTGKTNSIYMIRAGSLQVTREIILHETTHFYTFNFLPGGWFCYPDWFHEGLAMTYQKHTWNGDKLVIGFPPRLEVFDNPGSALTGLVRLRTYTKANAGNDSPDEAEPAKGKPAKKTTPIEPGLIQPFLDTQFSPGILRQNGVELKNPNEEIAHRYAMYQVFGRFLIAARPDVLGAILRQISQWENEKAKKPPKRDRFIEAWKKVAEEKPISIEDVGAWLQKNQLTFKWAFGDWQDMGDQIAGLALEGRAGVLLLRDPKMLPKFTVFPKNPMKYQVGMVINFVDNDHFGALCVNEDGKVLQMQLNGGVWISAKAVGSASPIQSKGGPSFFFASAQQGNVLRISINKTPVGDYPRIPNTSCGFFIGGTEAVFVP